MALINWPSAELAVVQDGLCRAMGDGVLADLLQPMIVRTSLMPASGLYTLNAVPLSDWPRSQPSVSDGRRSCFR
jgi:hypothetical protein